MNEKQSALLLDVASDLGKTLDQVNAIMEEGQGATQDDMVLLALRIVTVAGRVSDVIGLQMGAGQARGALIEALKGLVRFINKLDEREVFQFTPDLLDERDDVRAAGRRALDRARGEGEK